MPGFFSKLLSMGSDRELKEFRKIAAHVNELEPKFQKMDDVELRGQTALFRERYANGETLDPMYKDHALSGDLEGLRDCHIENDWVLLYFYTTTGELILTLSDTGTHADLF